MKHAAGLKAHQARIRRHWCIRKHWAHETKTAILQQYGTIVTEALLTKNMKGSAKGTAQAPGSNVAHKARLNRSILNAGWYQNETMLA